jgi:hypothetical protein
MKQHDVSVEIPNRSRYSRPSLYVYSAYMYYALMQSFIRISRKDDAIYTVISFYNVGKPPKDGRARLNM